DHVADLDDRLHIGGFQRALPDTDIGGHGGRLHGGIEVGALLGEGVAVGEIHDLEFAKQVGDAVEHAGDSTVRRDHDFAIAWRNENGAAVALHGITLGRH